MGTTSVKTELEQAKHRLEEAQARNRVKERNVRTHRLIQVGAILESILPEIKDMEPDSVKRLLEQRLSRQTSDE
jgi:hypothetical protein